MTRASRVAITVSAVLAMVTLVCGGFVMMVRGPSVPLLFAEGGAQWIRLDEAPILYAKTAPETVIGFRTRFRVEELPPEARLNLRAMKCATIYLDEEPMGDTTNDPALWKRTYCVDLAPRLSPGEHELLIVVRNQLGPACLLAYAPSLGIFTDQRWEASANALTWTPARLVTEPRPAEITLLFPRSTEALRQNELFFIALFVLAAAVALAAPALSRYTLVEAIGRAMSPGVIRCMFLALFAAIGINNALRLPAVVGFDVKGHIDYIEYIVRQGRIPLANEGWQMFQSPLFYMVCAPLYLLSHALWPAVDAVKTLRVVPLLCGLANIEIAYRMLRCIYPDNRRAQALGILFAGVLPINLYITQYLSNEPMCATFTALTLLLATRLWRGDADLSTGNCVLLGLWFALALLAKVTAAVLVPLCTIAILVASFRGHPSHPVRRATRALTLVFAVAAVVAGWYYVRNWIELGRPFVGGWDPSRGIVWWQDPGCRTPYDFFRFGQALVYPVYASMNGFWDGLYSTFWMDGFLSSIARYESRPPWNYSLMFSSGWFALAPSVLLILGSAKVLFRLPDAARSGLLLSLLCVGAYLGALASHYLTIPTYSVTKATYALGVLPCLAALFAAGADLPARHRWCKAVVYGLLACWSVSAYAGFFIR